MVVPMLLILRFAANIDPERLVELLVGRRDYHRKIRVTAAQLISVINKKLRKRIRR